jgi:hypothetical protein
MCYNTSRCGIEGSCPTILTAEQVASDALWASV